MYCSSCGNIVEDTDLYCAYCGVKISRRPKTTSSETIVSKTVEVKAQESVNQPLTTETKKPAKKPIWPIALSVVIVCFAVLAGIKIIPTLFNHFDSGEVGEDRESSRSQDKKQKNESAQEAQKLTAYEKLFYNKNLFVTNEEKLIGYINNKGEYVVEPKYKKAHEYSEGYVAVCDPETDLWGYLDLDGRYVIEPQYEYAHDFHEGLASVKKGYCWGVIDSSGKVIIDFYYNYISDYHEGYALVSSRGRTGVSFWDYIDKKGNIHSFDEYYEGAYLFNKGRAFVMGLGLGYYYMIDESGKLLSNVPVKPLEYSHTSYYLADADEYTAGEKVSIQSYYAYFNSKNQVKVQTRDGRYAYMDLDGNLTYMNEPSVPGNYEIKSITESNGIQIIKVKSDNLMGEAVGFADGKGNWLIEPQYISYFSGFNKDTGLGYAVVLDGAPVSGIGLMDKTGQLLYKNNQYSGYTMSFYEYRGNNDRVPAKNSNGKCGYLKLETGQETLSFIYDYVEAFQYDGSYAVAVVDGKAGLIDQQGNWLIEPKFRHIGKTDYHDSSYLGYYFQ